MVGAVRYIKLDDQVWCHYHGTIHDRSTSPYDYDESADCNASVWRSVFWAPRKGDLEHDERSPQ
jgi:hypothetical protein